MRDDQSPLGRHTRHTQPLASNRGNGRNYSQQSDAETRPLMPAALIGGTTHLNIHIWSVSMLTFWHACSRSFSSLFFFPPLQSSLKQKQPNRVKRKSAILTADLKLVITHSQCRQYLVTLCSLPIGSMCSPKHSSVSSLRHVDLPVLPLSKKTQGKRRIMLLFPKNEWTNTHTRSFLLGYKINCDLWDWEKCCFLSHSEICWPLIILSINNELL